MSRLIAGRVGALLVACNIAMLHGGCRYGYDLLPEGLVGAGAGAGDSGGDPTSQAGVGAGGSDGSGGSAAGAGEASAAAGDGASGGLAEQGGQAGEDSMAGQGGTAAGAGGESSEGSLPPLPCDEPRVWSTDFSSDPTALDGNGDAQPDWVVRGGAPFDTAELVAGVWRPPASKALDSFPKVNFSGRTQARVKMRDTKQTASGTPTTFAGALFWFNLDYQASDFLAVFSSITTPDGANYELGVFARANNTTETLAGPYSVPKDAFVVLELDFNPTTGVISTWVDGTAVPTTPPNRNTGLNSDQFATAIAPEGTGEFDELWVATCPP